MSLKNILTQAHTIAIIGCSKKKYRTSYHIAEYLQQNGYKIIPIHPDYQEILGARVYPTLKKVPETVTIDIVDIFRNAKYTAEMVDQIIEYQQTTGQKPVVWTQLNVSSEQARQKAEKAGLTYVENRCMMVEHERLLG